MKISSIDYQEYSVVITIKRTFCIYLMSLLPAIVYHGIHQELSGHSFSVLIILFIVMFYFGNGLSYRMVEHSVLWQTVGYSVVFPVVFSWIIWMTHGYLMTLTVLTSVVTVTGILILIVNRYRV